MPDEPPREPLGRRDAEPVMPALGTDRDQKAAYAAIEIRRDDDLAAIFGKVDAAASPRVALVAPRGNRHLARQLGMRRLQRHLDLSGKDVILVTPSRPLRVRARHEGLPAVGRLRRVDFEHPHGRALQLGWVTMRAPSLTHVLVVAASLIALVVCLVSLFWYVPSATVTVFLPTETLTDTVPMVVDAKAGDVDVARGVVPGRRREVTVTRSIPGPASGTASAPFEPAAVGLVFTNRTNTAVTVPRGTVVNATTGMAFTVGNDVNLPPRQGATADAIALAQRPGTAGNIPPNTATGIDGPFGQSVSVTNPAPGEKGTDLPLTVVNENDVEFLKRVAVPYLTDAAKAELAAQVGDTETIFPESAHIDITEAAPSPAIGQVAKYTEVHFTARASFLTAVTADVRRIAVDHFRSRISADRMLLDDQTSASFQRAATIEPAADRLPISPSVTVPVAQRVDRSVLRAALRGKDRGDAELVVRQRVDGAPPPRIELPRWAPWLPKKTDRITIVYQPADATGAGH